jgi:hypothetical protein
MMQSILLAAVLATTVVVAEIPPEKVMTPEELMRTVVHSRQESEALLEKIRTDIGVDHALVRPGTTITTHHPHNYKHCPAGFPHCGPDWTKRSKLRDYNRDVFRKKARTVDGGALQLDWSNTVIDFIHIPKAGGSSIRRLVWRWADRLGCAHAGQIVDVLDLSAEEQEPICMVSGHRGYGLHKQPEWQSKKRVLYFTIIRDPIARAISEFGYSHFSGKFIDYFRKNRHDDRSNPWKPT